jgi:hypothetical protein
MANAHARLVRRGLLAQEEWLANEQAGKILFRWPVLADGSDAATAAWFACVPSTLERGTEVEIGGKAVMVQLTLLVRRDQFHTADSLWHTADADESDENDAPLPTSGRLLKFKGVVYRIAPGVGALTRGHQAP